MLGYYGRATPLGRALGERLDVELRKQLTGCGHRSGSGHVLQVIAPEKAGGMGLGIEPAMCIESLVLGALSSSPVHRALVLDVGTNIAVLLVRLFEVV